ncbi:MAG: 2-oxo acid dehydrogenase subunit E2 [Bacteroidetes bacterium]|nr:2-oxo acid dehydrogenase subunit E2 [Bacteroidota bacterium]
MAKFELVMPKLGESIIEATIVRWLKKAGETITEDEPIADLSTDKVDSEIPSPVEGIITQTLFNEGDVVPVGTVIAIIDMGGESAAEPEKAPATVLPDEVAPASSKPAETMPAASSVSESGRFYSPLVRSIAKQENISLSELDKVTGSGKDGRLNKDDILNYLKNRTAGSPAVSTASQATVSAQKIAAPAVTSSIGDVVLDMDRMRKLIADHMVMSKQVSPHVTSFIEVDVTNIVRWRDKVKDSFLKREGQKVTFTPIFLEAVSKALREFPNVNASVDGYKIIQRKNVNIGMATALPDGNLIVPVIKNADQKNLLGIVKDVNDLADRARKNKLNPDDIQGGTFTITNFGSFDSLTGTPIINQPQVAILGIGTIKKRPWVLETSDGDVIAIRHICMLSLAYDHRIVDGALGGQFLKRMQQLLEGFDVSLLI